MDIRLTLLFQLQIVDNRLAYTVRGLEQGLTSFRFHGDGID